MKNVILAAVVALASVAFAAPASAQSETACTGAYKKIHANCADNGRAFEDTRNGGGKVSQSASGHASRAAARK
ncbi:hypothetical protein PHIM7_167 [Sinorhizobium phage phiM7]|uniref:Uncharacterized protein n=3 Tax=Emdodecavirus TaxID=1980937 RepID=S5MPW2_9CAUD|nr:hypothetical protein AB690_gp332 [Sinorhizobium phage phiM12]YP_009212419.1 hypothetical protein AVT40_gp354 [Sinorhizobium phage phiN3]YP_009601292.1 hypothetical protein FDH46_gp311 [Sinorhizobium phage phiM7]AKF13072.1 hypothetical protein PHIM19_167 [Sinorhizobium phage phiM19]AGR47870.1 hypothetical protein SmphiM12_238 [Sinorhizobium phage phiM12]AKF12712.1 hypothetical protein PHIM7_167 [Sinorhizobium phage phiM7]AKF13442.1 hypothetical protein PHIN3_179 [Sinorhizobium phage phiN3]